MEACTEVVRLCGVVHVRVAWGDVLPHGLVVRCVRVGEGGAVWGLWLGMLRLGVVHASLQEP